MNDIVTDEMQKLTSHLSVAKSILSTLKNIDLDVFSASSKEDQHQVLILKSHMPPVEGLNTLVENTHESSTRQTIPSPHVRMQSKENSLETLIKAEQLNLNFNNDLNEVCSWNNSLAIEEKIDLRKAQKIQEMSIFEQNKI